MKAHQRIQREKLMRRSAFGAEAGVATPEELDAMELDDDDLDLLKALRGEAKERGEPWQARRGAPCSTRLAVHGLQETRIEPI